MVRAEAKVLCAIKTHAYSSLICKTSVVGRGALTLAVASSEPLTSSGGPLRSGQQLLTKLSCSLIFFTCSPVAASQARTDLSGDALSTRSPSVVHCTSRTAFLCPTQHEIELDECTCPVHLSHCTARFGVGRDSSGATLSTRSPSVVHCTSRTAFLCPARHSTASHGGLCLRSVREGSCMCKLIQETR